MARKNPYRRGSNKWQYFDELRKLRNRTKQWERKYHISFTNIPTMPEKVTKKDIQRIKSIKYKNLSEAEKKEARFNYQWKYENEQLPDQYKPSKQFTPRSEDDYYDDYYYEEPEEPEPVGNEPADSYGEMDAWLQSLFDSILAYDDGGKNTEVRQILEGLLNDALSRLGKESMYNYLENGNIVSELHTYAVNVLSGSPDKFGNPSQNQMTEIERFATLLNLGRPLSQVQLETLQREGYIDYDFSDYD